MKTIVILFGALLLSTTTKAVDKDIFVRIKKNCRATYVNRDNINIPLKEGDTYHVLGRAGKMVVILVTGKKYYVAEGNVHLLYAEDHTPGMNPGVRDTVAFPFDSLGKY